LRKKPSAATSLSEKKKATPTVTNQAMVSFRWSLFHKPHKTDRPARQSRPLPAI
jgi:hypothetical protein